MFLIPHQHRCSRKCPFNLYLPDSSFQIPEGIKQYKCFTISVSCFGANYLHHSNFRPRTAKMTSTIKKNNWHLLALSAGWQNFQHVYQWVFQDNTQQWYIHHKHFPRNPHCFIRWLMDTMCLIISWESFPHLQHYVCFGSIRFLD